MMLEAREVDASYGDGLVLNGVSLAVGEGEFVALAGPNGCGKTTLLRVMTGVLRPRGGHVLLDGDDVNSMPAKAFAMSVAVVPQSAPTAAFNFSALEFVLMGRYPHLGRFAFESTADYELAEECLKQAGAWHLADRRLTHLSGGERQRLLIARALVQRPRILLLDEPTAHLDISHQAEMMQALRDLCEQGRVGILAALHDLNMAARHAGRIALMRKGSIVAAGAPHEVITEENVLAAYGAQAQIARDPATGGLTVSVLLPPG